MSATTYRAERYQPQTGYAVGTTDGGEWLIILGSHWETIPLFATAELAEAWFAERFTHPPGEWYRPTTRRVERCGPYFLIVDEVVAVAESNDQAAEQARREQILAEEARRNRELADQVERERDKGSRP